MSGVLAGISFTAVASAAPAGGGVQPVTTQPDLVSAAITDQPSVINAAGTPRLKACFDAPIASPVAANFAVSGTDVAGTGNPLSPASAASIPAELNCATLTFAAGTNLAGFSTLEAVAGAVSPAGGGAGSNPQGAVALTGGDVAPGAGKVSGPNLTGVAVAAVTGGTEVTFSFDKLITQGGVGAPVAARFGYYTTAGAAVPAASIVAVADRSVKVMFATAVVAGARVFAGNSAVTLAGQPDQGNAATAASGAGTAPPVTTNPDIVSVSRVAGQSGSFDVVYDQTITANVLTVANCEARTPTRGFAGTAVAVQNATTVRVTFGALAGSARSDEEVVRVDDLGGCVIDTSATPALSSVGAAGVQNKDHTPGFTSGPDLTGCAAPAGTDVTYAFDELLATAAPGPGGFALIDASGARIAATSVVSATDDKVTVRFASAGVLAAAAACTVDRGAVSDRQPVAAEPGSLNTVRVNTTGTPENTGSTAPVVTPPVTTPGAARKFVPLAARSLGIIVSCHRSSGRVRCTTKGTLKLASVLSVFGKKACIGSVRIRYTAGSKVLSSKSTKIKSTCRYTSTVTFKASKSQRSRLRVQARYGGSVVSRAKSSKKVRGRVR
ncbi:MAG TPA: hypothetical protein VL120_12125 [Solirubrobacteraceae bacterium]|nr:hypothetical protein [Solirubrobacteraceae bacterium]